MLPGFRQLEFPVFPYQQLCPDFIFKCFDGLRDAGLGDVAQFCRLCKTVLLYDGLKMLYLTKHHSVSPPALMFLLLTKCGRKVTTHPARITANIVIGG